jgi:two-component system, NtrC family, nitrogen regulation sensor histidine kinase NtrY
MPRRLRYGLYAVLFIVSVALIVWQGSFSGSFGSFAPDDPETFVIYGVSTIIFLVFVYLGFMFVRLIWKIWIERASDRPGSRIKTKLVAGALMLSVMPVFFMVFFSVYVLNNSIGKWFNLPAEHERVDFDRIAKALDRQTRDKANAEAELLAATPETRMLLAGGAPGLINPGLINGDAPAWLAQFCRTRGIVAASITRANVEKPIAVFGEFPGPNASAITVWAPVANQGLVQLAVAVPVDVAKQQRAIEDYHRAFAQLSSHQRAVRRNYLWLLTVIALFILFVASWLAHYLARQISGPISAVLRAVEEVSRGNLGYRVKVTAVDELAQLVSGFNRMTGDLEANRTEIEARRRFTEAILESIPTGVISVDSGGAIQLVNKAFTEMFPDLNARGSHTPSAVRLDDLFAPEDAAEIRYLMNRARRTGHATQQLEIKAPRKTLHLAVTVSSIEGRRGSGFVIVIEDTSDLLRAQKTAAWSEVARRVAHEIKNPLTPIALSAERILRQMNRRRDQNGAGLPPAIDKVVRECAETILEETASVKRLVDEFSQFSRLPAAQPVTCELNDVVAGGLGVFAGRLEGIEVRVDLAPGLPPVSIDPEQFKRVVVNLIDNAAEAMQDSALKVLSVQTRAGAGDMVEIVFADTGCGITPDQKEKLFLPYFSTKGRGTGLGLAIVSHILTEHNANIRVEDNRPCGAWFTVEVPAAAVEKQSPPVATAALA